ncbi:FAD-binding and (Fe-S)-binding domain-containing protein [Trujillonella humicola]|uniref:FAD-binding and (Fe-S)-binding domain-containing protein n=1 Tax=Trujillonella humicola TaxID=3383699 RepID=UPI003905C3E2
MSTTAPAQTRELAEALRSAGLADVDDSGLARALYSSDGSLYRVLPRAVVRPRHPDELVATLEVCRELGVPLTARGAGTSIAGNAVGPGVVVDTSRYLHRVRSIDAEAGTASIDPGVVQAALQTAARPHGLRFGPDPSTHNRCTVGGMIGNNACGSRALGYGRTSDNVVGLDVVTGGGERLALGAGMAIPAGSPTLDRLRELVAGDLAAIRTELGRFGRQVSGYSLEHLLPERGFDVARALVGSEGTLALVLGATVRLVADAPFRGLVVLGYPSMAEAADATPALLPHGPTAVEGLDERIVQRLRDVPAAVVPELPRGNGWLIVELTGDSVAEVQAKGRGVVAAAGALDTMVVTDVAQAAAIWRIREDGAGLAARTSDGRPAHAGWEDAAVPVEQLGGYLREFDALLAEHSLQGVPYGHFGDGCVHVRIDFPFGREPDRGRGVYRAFVTDAAALVARHGGSISGEHGDGRARGELLASMYSSKVIGLFERVKAAFDPDDVLNPGVLVRPAPVDAGIRVTAAPRLTAGLAFAYPHDGGDLSNAVHRCTGVGKCRADLTASGGVMCPSFVATREEKDSTRGRARVLQEMIAPGGPVTDWRSPEVHQALDLCLSCKGCARDCPTGVDMATYKAEVLHQTYRRRIRPRSHYVLGRLPFWSDLAARTPRLANAVMSSRLGGRLAKWTAGVDQRRSLPAFSPRTFRADWAVRRAATHDGAPVALWVDSFTDHFAPEVAHAAVAVLEGAGYRVQVPGADTCCGLTWITTGQLDAARRTVGATVAALAPLARAGVPIVGLEPSCTAVLRGEAKDLVPGADADAVAGATRTLAELLRDTPGWEAPDLSGLPVVAQPHCHHHATMGWTTDETLLRDAGAQVQRMGGCCGLAGNWGVEKGHHDVSVAIAGHQLLPAVQALPAGGVVLADGFSCRTQLDDLAGRRGLHLAELLAQRLPSRRG